MMRTDLLINNLPPVNYNSSACSQREKTDILKQCASVNNIPNDSYSCNDLTTKSANVIKGFFRKSIAAQSYGKMFSTGARFKELGIDLSPLEKEKFSFTSLQHLDKISNSYLNEIKEKTQNLTPQEKKLVDKVVAAKLHFRHQSNYQLVTSNDVLNIKSMIKLQSEGYRVKTVTNYADVKELGNHDFVFLGVEFSDDKSQLPLNTQHADHDYGAYAYLTDDQFPHAYLTLTDHLCNQVRFVRGDFGYEKFALPFTEMLKEKARIVRGDKSANDVPIYNVKDMKLALGLHLIDFLRNSNDSGFKEFTLSENLNSKQLDGILNYIFYPEFHVPRMISTTNFTKVKLRDVKAEDAVHICEVAEDLLPYLKSKDDACIAISQSLKLSKIDFVSYLLSKFDFTKEDIIKIKWNQSYSLAFCLVAGKKANVEILKMFLERGLIDPNEPVLQGQPDTMLDRANIYKSEKIIEVLLSYGATCCEKLREEGSRIYPRWTQ
ncbi:T3SS effector OspC family protein [Klebsiella sp. BIGb0407]|uniref:T3SS effector OspC family protein n=1 Tax=Klebsiella sp. BIGb0407 TaxID=2940603 RepID=UPI0021688CA6|nr:T3SS effector OspC family protein [Klebsiella sp. BIGb0407]MCS3432123.1 hypothetical protein [Klebsiella sp. BIGb0407]